LQNENYKYFKEQSSFASKVPRFKLEKLNPNPKSEKPAMTSIITEENTRMIIDKKIQNEINYVNKQLHFLYRIFLVLANTLKAIN